MNPNYPTKEEILEKKPKFRKGTIQAVKLWKKEYIKGWKFRTDEEKIKLLKSLIKSLEEIYEKPVKEVIASNDDFYDTKSRAIYLNAVKPSIISTLHEFAHHILGDSELKACVFSVWLFKLCFPGLYLNLQWKEHLLLIK